MTDLEELIHLMQDRPRGTMVRCSKARAMFAMRACRRSVMIGKALDKMHMTTVRRSGIFHVRLLTFTLPNADRKTHGNNGSTLELSPWSTDDATFIGFDVLWAICTAAVCD